MEKEEIQEDRVIRLEDGTMHCIDCVVGNVTFSGGPIGTGIEGAGDPRSLFLHKCDVCGKLYRLMNEERRLDIVQRYEGYYDSYNRKTITFKPLIYSLGN